MKIANYSEGDYFLFRIVYKCFRRTEIPTLFDCLALLLFENGLKLTIVQKTICVFRSQPSPLKSQLLCHTINIFFCNNVCFVQ